MTNEEKQIEEMRNYLHEAEIKFCVHCRSRRCQECEYYFAKSDCRNQIFAEHLYANGYLKASEVAREVEEIIDKEINVWEKAKIDLYPRQDYYYASAVVVALSEIKEKLKKKYESEENKE